MAVFNSYVTSYYLKWLKPSEVLFFLMVIQNSYVTNHQWFVLVALVPPNKTGSKQSINHLVGVMKFLEEIGGFHVSIWGYPKTLDGFMENPWKSIYKWMILGVPPWIGNLQLGFETINFDKGVAFVPWLSMTSTHASFQELSTHASFHLTMFPRSNNIPVNTS